VTLVLLHGVCVYYHARTPHGAGHGPRPATPRSPLTEMPPTQRRGAQTLLPREQWRRNQLAVTVAAAMVFLGFTLVMPFLPFYVQTLGIRGMRDVALWSGVLLTITPLLAALLGPIWGRLAARVGMKIMVQRILFAITVHWGLMYFVDSIWQMLGLRIFLGLFSGFGTMSVALVTHGCPRDRIGRAVGVLQATQILSTALGPLVGGLLAQAIGIRQTFVVTFVLCATAFVFVLALYRDTGPALEPRAAETIVVPQEGPVSAGVRALVSGAAAGDAGGSRGLSFREILGTPMFAHLLPQLFLLNLVDRSLFLVVPLFVSSLATEPAGAEAVTGVVVSAGALASAASAYLLGHKAGQVSPMSLLFYSLAGSTVTIVPMAFCRSVLPFAALRFLLGLAVGGAMTLAYTIGGHLLPPEALATGYSILSSTAMLGGALGPTLCGLLAAIDVRAPILIGGLVYLVLTLHVVALSRRAGQAGALAARPPVQRRA
jgi:DHA1 family multidrug resistance protein-like MFS transporter